MATEDTGAVRRRRRRRTDEPPVDYGPAPSEVHPSIVALRGRHRAAHPDLTTKLEAASHLLMISEWPVNCPRFMDGLREVGLHCVSQLQYLRLDHHLLTALVERWSPQTNTFHLAVGEMTVTLQDVAMILGVQIDGPPVIGSSAVGVGRRWQTWPDCCDELIGRHPEPDVVYHDPFQPHLTSTFRMGQAHARTCMPLRWLRWTFFRDSYLDIPDVEFWRHVRAYILFTIGCFLMPDTSGSEVHLQYLPLLEDLTLFSKFSIGSAVLAHLYRELNEATRPKRTNMAGCLHLLQVWSWEHLHVGRPTLQVPYPVELEGLSVGCRWNETYRREMKPAHVIVYRDELDGLLQSQVIWEPYGQEIRTRVADVCLAGREIWLARVPLICWKRIEWYLPDRVLRQFGLSPRVDADPIDPSFPRVDGRGKADVDWSVYHQPYILQWEARHDAIVDVGAVPPTVDPAVSRYMRWYRSWASLYMLRAPTIPPTTYYPRAPGERLMREHILDTQDIFSAYFGRDMDSDFQHSINTYEELCRKLNKDMHISDNRYRDADEASSSYAASQSSQPHATGFDAGPSSMPDVGPYTYPYSTPAPYSSQEGMFSPFQSWQAAGSSMYPHPSVYMPQMHPVYPIVPFQPGPSQEISDVTPLDDTEQTTDQAEDDVRHQQHHLRDRPRRPPAHYTPGSDALPPRRHRRH